MLQDGDSGSFEELSQKQNPKNLVLLYIPGLEALFERAIQLKGTDLSNKEKRKLDKKLQLLQHIQNWQNK